MGVLGVKFLGQAAVFLHYNLDEHKGEMKEFISVLHNTKTSVAPRDQP